MTRKAHLFTVYMLLCCYGFWSSLLSADTEDFIVTLTSGKLPASDQKTFNAEGKQLKLVTTEVMVDGASVRWSKTKWELTARAAAEQDGYVFPEADEKKDGDSSCANESPAFVLAHAGQSKSGDSGYDESAYHGTSCIFDPNILKVHVSCLGASVYNFTSYLVTHESPMAQCNPGQNMMVSVIVSPGTCGFSHRYTYKATVETT